MEEAERLFRNAIEKDPKFALAYVGLADRLVMESDPARASITINKALELDPNLAEAYATAGFINTFHTWEWPSAESNFKKSIELNPGYATAHHWYATLLAIQGRNDEAKAEMRRALEINPVSHNLPADLGQIHYFAREYDQAEEYCRKALEVYPEFTFAHGYLSSIYLQKGDFNKAVDEYLEFQKSFQTQANQAEKEKKLLLDQLAEYRAIYQKGGIRKFLEYLISLNEKDGQARYPNVHYQHAVWYSFLGHQEKALDNLEKAYQGKSFLMVFVKADPVFDPLRSEPRYQEILRKMNLL
jgi:tetratricopeptide (TPR) repeat protein